MNWMNLEKFYPPFDHPVLITDIESGMVTIGKRVEDDIFEIMSIDEIEIDIVATHWMPLPEPPLKVED